MTQFLPPNLLALFQARGAIPFMPPPSKKKSNEQPYSGVSPYLTLFEDPKDTPPPTRGETRDEKQERKRREKLAMVEKDLEEKMAEWDPHSDANADGDPFKTLYVARINFETTESKLRRELEVYGPIVKINMIYDKVKGKSLGYAFVEYEHERDMHSAYKNADGKKIDGRRILVDVERGRTVKSWRPRRLGGGLGGTRRGGADVNIKISGRVDNYENREENDRERDRERDGEREKRRRSRSRDKDRDRERRERRRDRDRDRERGDRDRNDRIRERDRGDRGDRGDRDRDRVERDRGERDRSERDRGDRDRDRDDREDRRSRRDRDRDRGDRSDRDRDRSDRGDRDRARERDRNDRDDDDRRDRDRSRGDYDDDEGDEDSKVGIRNEAGEQRDRYQGSRDDDYDDVKKEGYRYKREPAYDEYGNGEMQDADD